MKKGYGPRFVCFIDLLGVTSNVLKANSARDPYIVSLRNAIDDVHRSLRLQSSKDSSEKIRFDFISDSIFIVSNDPSPRSFAHVLFCAQEVAAMFLRAGFLSRGGLAYGECYSYQRTLLGKAVVKAVNLEKSVAKYPRIVIGRDARLQMTKEPFFADILVREETGPLWIDTFGYFRSTLRDAELDSPEAADALRGINAICSSINSSIELYQEEEKILNSYWWLRKYYFQSFEPLIRKYGERIALPTDLS